MYKALAGLAPKYISDLLIAYSPQRALRSSNQFLLTVPRCRCKTKGGRAFSAAAPKLWNSLPVNVRLAPSLASLSLLLNLICSPWLLNNARLRLCCQLGLDSIVFFFVVFLHTVFAVLYLLYSTLCNSVAFKRAIEINFDLT